MSDQSKQLLMAKQNVAASFSLGELMIRLACVLLLLNHSD